MQQHRVIREEGQWLKGFKIAVREVIERIEAIDQKVEKDILNKISYVNGEKDQLFCSKSRDVIAAAIAYKVLKKHEKEVSMRKVALDSGVSRSAVKDVCDILDGFDFI